MDYVLSLSGRQPDAAASAENVARRQSYASRPCARPVTAPTVKAIRRSVHPISPTRIWLYGGSVNDIRETITNGRTNQMPAHLERLGETKVRLLAAYVLSLSRPLEPGPAEATQDHPP